MIGNFPDIFKGIPVIFTLLAVFASAVKGFYEIEQHKGALDDHGGKLIDLYHRDERMRERFYELERECIRRTGGQDDG